MTTRKQIRARWILLAVRGYPMYIGQEFRMFRIASFYIKNHATDPEAYSISRDTAVKLLRLENVHLTSAQ